MLPRCTPAWRSAASRCALREPLKEIPDDGIADFLDSPRFSPATRRCTTRSASCPRRTC
jgi:hypothetical protein